MTEKERDWMEAASLAKRILLSNNKLEESNIKAFFLLHNEIFRPKQAYTGCPNCAKPVVNKVLQHLAKMTQETEGKDTTPPQSGE